MDGWELGCWRRDAWVLLSQLSPCCLLETTREEVGRKDGVLCGAPQVQGSEPFRWGEEDIATRVNWDPVYVAPLHPNFQVRLALVIRGSKCAYVWVHV